MQRLLRILHRKVTWVVLAAFAVYTLFGFFAAPRILRAQILGRISDQLGRTATLKDVKVNPLTLSVRLQGFELLDTDGGSFVAFAEFFVDFQVSSLVRRAFTFKTVRLVSPQAHVRLMPDEKPNFQDIVDRARARPVPPTPAQPKRPPRLLLQRIEIQEARLRATNLANPQPETVAFTPIDLALRDFTTIPKRDGSYTLRATGQGGGQWEWSGSLTFEPMRSAGTFSIQGEQLPALWEVVRRRVAWEVPSGVAGLRLRYAVEVRADSVRAAVTEASVSLDRFRFRAQGRDPDLLSLDSLRIDGIELRYPQQTIAVRRIGLNGLRGTAWLEPSGALNWKAVLAPPVLAATGVEPATPAAAAPAPAVAARPAPSWKVSVDEIALTGGDAGFMDSTVTPPFAIGLAPIDVRLRHVSSEPGSDLDLEATAIVAEHGSLSLRGKARAQPPAADLAFQLRSVPLPIFQPYVGKTAKLVLVSGDLGADGQLTVRVEDRPAPPDFHLRGEVWSQDFLSRDAGTNERFLAWKKLELRRVTAAPDSIHIATVEARAPYGRIIIFRDRTTNIAQVLGIPPRDTTAAAVPARPSPPPAVHSRIDLLRLVDGTGDFADLSLLLPFAAGIDALNGEVRGLSSDSLARAQVMLDGGLRPAGSVRVRGEINPLSGDLYTDLVVDFNDFDMPALSPYTGQFLGRKVDQGKLWLGLQYKVAQRQLDGDNKVVIDQLELGESVESPEATGLPIGLAVALLKDRNGKIDLDLPVSGNLDDPRFSIWRAVLHVLKTLVVKLVTAPFSLLGRLIGFGGDDHELSYVQFAAGQDSIPVAEHQKVIRLADALAQRPKLRLEVRGACNAGADAAALRDAKFTALADERSKRDPKRYPPTLGGAGYAPQLFRDLYVESMGQGALAQLESRCQVPKIDKEGKPHPKDTVLDAGTFYAEIRRELTAAQAVDASELRALAQDRSTAVKDLLVQTGKVEAARIFLLDVDEDGPLNDGQVRVELRLGG